MSASSTPPSTYTPTPTKYHQPAPVLAYPHLALIGGMGAGKSLLAEWLVKEFPYQRRPFAAKLKDMAAELWGEDARTNREILQGFGCWARQYDEDVWVRAWERNLTDGALASIVVDDCRFPNEYWKLKERGFVVVRVIASYDQRLTRLQAIGKIQDEEQFNHPSETSLDGFRADHAVYNTEAPEDAYAQLLAVIDHERRRA